MAWVLDQQPVQSEQATRDAVLLQGSRTRNQRQQCHKVTDDKTFNYEATNLKHSDQKAIQRFSISPRTSSLAMRMSSVTSEKTVGSMKKPFKPRALPPHSSLAPSLMPLWINSSTRFCCSRLICKGGGQALNRGLGKKKKRNRQIFGNLKRNCSS